MADQDVLDAEAILQVVRTWPRDQQVQLARALLDQPFDPHGDLGLATVDPLTGRPYVASADLRGIGTGGRPAPSDEEIERWRLEKYGE
ncbi:MAG TPA: hypothetical protein VIG30_06245 [Ktedonobacterales bacterium]|jgi:hypothetical protein